MTHKLASFIPQVLRITAQERHKIMTKWFHKSIFEINANKGKYQTIQRNEFDEENINYLKTAIAAMVPPKTHQIFEKPHLNILQYPANNPIEDSVCYENLTTIDGITVSVFDGHGGPQMAQYSSKIIHKLIDKFISQNQQKPQYRENIPQMLKDSLKWSYQELENIFYSQIYLPQLQLGNKKLKNIGTCGVTVIIYQKIAYVANSGDSQAIIFQQDQSKEVSHIKCNSRLSTNNPAEKQRLQKQFPDDQRIIINQGSTGYLKGRLQPTRTLGDYYLKMKKHFREQGQFRGPYLVCSPDIKTFPILPEYQCMVVASDGLWDLMKKTQISTLLKKSINEKSNQNFQKILLKECLYKVSQYFKTPITKIEEIPLKERRNYHDDITIVVIQFKP